MITFAQPAFLWALPALAVPIFLHLMQRQIPRRVMFPSIRFILKGQDLQHGRRGLRDLLTLLARLFFLALIILLFAEPQLQSKQDIAAVGTQAQVVLLVDVSSSMSAGDLSKFLQETVTSVDQKLGSPAWGLIVSGNGIGTRIPVGLSSELLLAELAKVSALPVPGQHGAALQAVPELFKGGAGRKLCVIASDMQAADWGALSLAPLRSKVNVEVVRPSWSTENMGIMSVERRVFGGVKGRRLQASVRIRNFSLDAKDVRLRLHAGEATTEQAFHLAGRGIETFVMELELADARQAEVTLLDADAYEADNHYFLSITPQAPVKVAIIHADRAESQLEAFFLKRALEAKHPGHDFFELKVATPLFFIQERLANYSCIFILDALKRSTRFDVEALREWVGSGGTAVYFSGRDSISCLPLLKDGKLTEVTAAALRGDVRLSRTYVIQQIDRTSSVLAPFAREDSDLTSFPIFRYADLTAGSSGQTLLALGNDAPLLIQENHDAGRVFTFAIGLVPSWSDFPTSQSFLPLVRRIAETSGTGGGRGELRWMIGEPIPSAIKELVTSGGESLGPEPGVKDLGGRPIEVNISRRESELQRLDEAESHAEMLAGKLASAGRTDREDAAYVGVTRWLGCLFLIIAAAEVLLANVGIGRKSRA
ncbi:hypothetical protein BVY04_01965 [bacterium M21]|nr:hypothetical protein BVY04_01965 [bacterium M21]